MATEGPKFGSKSSEDPNRRHFFKWSGERSGEGTGKCMYCGLRMKFAEKGPRGGRMRLYSKDGKSWNEKELQCHVREHAVAAKEPAKAKKAGKKAAKKNGTKRAAAGAKKGAGKKTARNGGSKKRASKKPATPAAEATTTAST